MKAYLWTGPRFKWGCLSFDSIDKQVLRGAGIRTRKFEGKYLRAAKLAAIQSGLIGYYENHGHPFASVWLDSMEISGANVSGRLRVEPGTHFTIDSLHIRGDVKIHPGYIHKLTGIVPGDHYQENRIRKIQGRIRETVFLEEIRPHEIEFHRGGVDVYTYLKKSRANVFNGIAGFLPRHNKTGKLLVTGDVSLGLVNTLGRGESFYFGWKSLEPLTQELEIQLGYPFVLGTNMGLAFGFDLLKQDSTYLNLNPVIDLRFFLGGSSYLNAFYDHFSSSVISTHGLENAVVLPPYADVTGSLYGLGLQYRNLDYPLNPSRGMDIGIRLGIGTRKIRKNPSVNNALYDDLDLNTTRVKSTAVLSFFLPLGGSFVMHLKGSSGYLGDDRLFENELFRLGGIGSIRGIDENSVYASAYALGTAEAKFLFEQGSAFFIFFDGGYYEKDLEGEFTGDWPMGFGAGIQLRTGAGIFLLNYALGRQFENPVNIGEAKIHIGYVNRF